MTPNVAALAAIYGAGLPGLTDAELAVQAGRAAARPGALAGEMRRLVDAERESRRSYRILRIVPGPIDLRDLFSTPPDLRLADVGGVCPIDDTVLIVTRPAGLACPNCLAVWPATGQDGRWVDAMPSPIDRVGAVAVRRVLRWFDRRGTAELVDDADLNTDALALLNRIREQRGQAV